MLTFTKYEKIGEINIEESNYDVGVTNSKGLNSFWGTTIYV